MTTTLPPAKLAEVTRQIGALSALRVPQLKARLQDILGRPVHSNNRAYLVRKLAWHIRDQAEGQPVPRTLQALLDAGPAVLPERWRERLAGPAHVAMAESPVALNPARDPRLPLPGTELVRVYQAREHRVVVHEADFEYAGVRYRSLSAVAKHITGTPWNGMAFFGLKGAATRSGR